MSDYDNLDIYNGDTEHDMWVDFTNYEYTGEPDVFDEDGEDDTEQLGLDSCGDFGTCD